MSDEEILNLWDCNKITCGEVIEAARADERAKFAEWLYENYIVNDNHNEEVSTEDLLWEYTNK